MSTSQGSTGEPRRSRGRPRTPGAEKRIIDAALEEYGEHGWSGFTMDGVARRAGVGKSTVYLRWQDKDTLLTDAVSSRSDDLGDVDTAGAAQRLGGFVEAVTDVQAEFIEQMAARAVERGELVAGYPPLEIGQCIYGSVIVQTLTTRLQGLSLEDDEIDRRADALVELVLEGAGS